MKKGQPFPVVMEDFLNWCGEDEYVFCTWGSMDLTELQRNMTYHGMEIPFPRPLLYYDVQKLYSLEYSDGKSRISLDHAVEQLELNQERPFHRALDDAVYTGRTLRMIHMETYGIYRSIDYYRLPERGSSYKLKFPEYSKYISGEFDCKEEILKDKEISDIICVKCSRMLRKKDPLVFLWAAVLFCTGYLSGTWLYEGQDPGEEIGTGSVLCSKDDQGSWRRGAAYASTEKRR